MENTDLLNQVQNKIDEINNNNPTELLGEVKDIVNKLNGHIDETITLTQKEIINLCQNLTVYTTLPAIPIETGLWVGRARIIEDKDNYYTDTSQLSYIPKESGIKAPLGRMNRYNQSMFYCSFGGKITNDNLVNTILSEVNAEKNESYCMLASQITDPIRCSPIGAFDYYRRGIPHPFRLHDDIKKLYEIYKQHTHKDGMLAMELCDAFLRSVLEKENSEKNNRLYEVTSEIANDCMSSEIDGIIYPSVKFEGYPNIVLHPDVVDKKLSHKFVYDYKVVDKIGYGMYKFEEKAMAIIFGNSNRIPWPNETYSLSNGSTVSYF